MKMTNYLDLINRWSTQSAEWAETIREEFITMLFVKKVVINSLTFNLMFF